MATANEIGQAGEEIVANGLRAAGWRVQQNTQLPGSTDIDGTKNGRHILCQVKTAQAPNEPTGLSSDERRNIKSRATRIGAEAWEALVQLDSRLNPTRGVKWNQL